MTERLYYGYSKEPPAIGFIYALKCENKFYVITQQAYENVRQRLKNNKPSFHTNLKVYIDGINI